VDTENTVSAEYCHEACEFAVIGGGRWGKILTKVLNKDKERVSKVTLISEKQLENNKKWGLENDLDKDRVQFSNNLQKTIDNKNLKMAIVANRPCDHYRITKSLLLANKNVLVEKPFVPCVEQAQELINIANERNLTLAVGLEFFFSQDFQALAGLIEKEEISPAVINLNWSDVFSEKRHGELKVADMTVNVFQDLAPHALTMLSLLLGEGEISLKEIYVRAGGNCTNLKLMYGNVEVNLGLDRDAMFTHRKIEVISIDNKIASLDFTKEPGVLKLGANEISDNQTERIGSLDLGLRSFYNEVQTGNNESKLLASKNLNIIKFIEETSVIIQEKQTQVIRRKLLEDYPTKANNEVINSIREHLLADLSTAGLILNPKDVKEVKSYIMKVFKVIHKLSFSPFASQKEIADQLDFSRSELKSLNSVLRRSDFAQNLITNGHGEKYWHNSIIPLVKSGVIKAAHENKYIYPYRVGVYLGPSCMFNCSFCGRNPEEKYETSDIKPGNEILKKMFDEAPKNDPYRFYISGGLEPLTNPGIGEVVSYGAEKGFNLSMYTNGFMLTPNLLSKQPGLWDLDTIRISLYGVDEETTFAVNSKKNSFARVIGNATDFLKLRDEVGSNVKFGFNFVILPGCVDQVMKLIELIASINKNSGAKRQIDFLTLREDYSVDTGLLVEERKKLISCFQELEQRCKEDDLKDLYIDYGYALHSPKEGMPGEPLARVHHTEMREQGYAQVSLVVDLIGDVYLYREAGFIGRKGADRYIIGRTDANTSVEDVVKKYVEEGTKIKAVDGDVQYFDAFDHLVTKLMNQVEDDESFEVGFDEGPVRGRLFTMNLDTEDMIVGHPSLPGTVAHPSLPTTVAHPSLPTIVAHPSLPSRQ
jgi:dTDP-4-amino-4,6-dideoxy-D-glucose ammonia-lyase